MQMLHLGPDAAAPGVCFWHCLLLLEGASLDETGEVTSLAGAGKRLQYAPLISKCIIKISATLIKNN